MHNLVFYLLFFFSSSRPFYRVFCHVFLISSKVRQLLSRATENEETESKGQEVKSDEEQETESKGHMQINLYVSVSEENWRCK